MITGDCLMVVFRVCVRVYPSSKNIHTAFEDLIKGDDYTDVTFAWGDGHTNEAHKVIIAALLKRNKHSLIYMRGIKSEDLLKIAEELQLKGLNGSEGDIENPPKFLVNKGRMKHLGQKLHLFPNLIPGTTSCLLLLLRFLSKNFWETWMN